MKNEFPIDLKCSSINSIINIPNDKNDMSPFLMNTKPNENLKIINGKLGVMKTNFIVENIFIK